MESPRRSDRNKSNHVSNGGGWRAAVQGRSSISRLMMGLNQPNGPGAGPSPYEHLVRFHHRGFNIIPIDDQIGPIYTVSNRDTASRGLTTIATPKSQFRTDPSDQGKAPSNIAPSSPRYH
ncbi:hypothetical protein F511_08605 [Dorcoceras hygrometricum]|uniref:Uncharacterized protein n=1 Tax=Dorcoceras hygrometricum TaxID=472368 RepID=A0A2Z7BHC1_9LAMI|nr:hypothetical protein F511_08605 [Dorcoceras hygrometricum]